MKHYKEDLATSGIFMTKKGTLANNFSSIKRFRILVVGPKKSGKNILLERLIRDEKYKSKQNKDSEVLFGLFEKFNEKFIVEFYDNFHYQLNFDRIKFLERCNLAIIIGNISETEIGESVNTIEEFEYDLGKLFPYFIPFRTLKVRTKVNPNDSLDESYREEICFKNSFFVDLSKDENEINNELMILKDEILTQISAPIEYHLIEKINTKLESENISEQQLALHMIGKYQLKQFNEEITKLAFSNENVKVKCAAIWALGQLGLTKYTEKLISLFQKRNSIDNELTSEVLVALLKIIDSSKRKLLEEIKASSSILARVYQLPFEILLSERETLLL